MSLFPCPHCHQHIKKQSDQCPHCKKNITEISFSDDSTETIYGVAMISFPSPSEHEADPQLPPAEKNTIQNHSENSILSQQEQNNGFFATLYRWWNALWS